MIRETSIKAYHEIDTNMLKEHILNFYKIHPSGLTDSELCSFFNPDTVIKAQPRARRNELYNGGLVFNLEKRVCEVSGKKVIVWGLK